MSPGARLAVGACCLVLGFPVAGEPYVDQVLDDGPQPALVLERELARESGWPRGWRLEANAARDSGAQNVRSTGLALSGYLDTPDYGSLSLSGTLSTTRQYDIRGDIRSPTARLWRLDQRALPLDDGWIGNHSVGDLAVSQVPMTRGFGRIGLPSSPLEGATMEYSRGSDTLLTASLGRPGVYSGLGVNGFNPARGRLSGLGGQRMWAGANGQASTVAFQLSDAHRIAEPGNPGLDQNVQGFWSAYRWEGYAPWSDGVAPGPLAVWQRAGGLQLQANAMRSSSETDSASVPRLQDRGAGIWLDAQWRSSWLQQAAGLFYLQPHLRWGTYTAVSDLRGLYWRGDLSTRQWQLSGSAEWTDSVSGANGPAAFSNITARYRFDTRNSVLAAASVRRINAPGESLQAGWEHASDWGQTQWLADVLRAPGRRSARMGVDHNFIFASSSSVAVSAALQQANDAGGASRLFGWGLAGSVRPWPSVSLEANVRMSRGGGGQQVNGNVGFTWNIDSNWSLLGQLSSAYGEDPLANVLVSPLTQAATQVVPSAFSARRLQVTLRYEDRAGQAMAPIGGAPGTGAGGITGIVFFDGNNNGRREASEAGVPDITIRLDDRYITRTDAQGRYVFPAVAAGVHRLQVVPDNVPLPWNPATPEPQSVHVLVRSESTLDFGMRREP
jgi:SdrD B-like domain